MSCVAEVTMKKKKIIFLLRLSSKGISLTENPSKISQIIKSKLYLDMISYIYAVSVILDETQNDKPLRDINGI